MFSSAMTKLYTVLLDGTPSGSVDGDGNLIIGTGGTDNGWDLTTFFENVVQAVQRWGGMFIVLLGVIMIIVAVYQAAKGLISHGKTQTNWFITATLLILGGALAVGGWSWVYSLARGGQITLNQLGGGASAATGGTGSMLGDSSSTILFGLRHIASFF